MLGGRLFGEGYMYHELKALEIVAQFNIIKALVYLTQIANLPCLTFACPIESCLDECSVLFLFSLGSRGLKG